jgi:membrane protein DedA with SNARE-associated domain
MYFEFIPSLVEILAYLRTAYEVFGYPGLFIGSFLEGLVYLGLYFPGSLIIIVAAAFSNGTLVDFMKISSMVTIAISLASIVNYYFGKYSLLNSFLKPSLIRKEQKKTLNVNFIFTFFHPNLLAFYVYTLGSKKESIF